LIRKKISKIGATRSQILRLKCSKIDFGWGTAPDPTGLQCSPDPLAVFKGPTSKGKEGEGKRGGKREGKGRGRETEGRGWAERPYTPTVANSWMFQGSFLW